MDLRPGLTRVQFDEAAASLDDYGFPLGRGLFPSTSSARETVWGSEVNLGLNASHRTLLLWRKIVGRAWDDTNCGIFDLFRLDIETNRKEALALLKSLDWPELDTRMSDALRAYEPWKKEEDKKFAVMSDQVHVIMRKRTGKPLLEIDPETVVFYAMNLAQNRQLVLPIQDRTFTDAFKSWLYSEGTKKQAVLRVRAWIHESRDDLCRIVDA